MKSLLVVHQSPQNMNFFKALEERCLAQGVPYQERASLPLVSAADLAHAAIVLIEVTAQDDLNLLRGLEFSYGLVFHLPSLPASNQKNLLALAKVNTRVHSMADTERGVDFYWPFWRSLYGQQESATAEQAQLAQLTAQVERLKAKGLAMTAEMKNLHGHLVPGRQQKLKNATIWTKYAAGERPGGDYYDFVFQRGDVYLFMVHASSYLLSSAAMASFDQWRQGPRPYDLKKLIAALAQQNQAAAAGAALEVLVVKFDLRHLTGEGFCFGPWTLVSSGELYQQGNTYPCDPSFMPKARLTFKLDRGEILTFLSPGVPLNLQKAAPEKELIDFFRPWLNKRPREVLDELFFQMQRPVQRGFLEQDASAVMLEVHANALWEVQKDR